MAEDYPKTLLAFEQRFATEEACRAYLFALRWPNGFVCPRCQGRQAWATVHQRWVCTTCRHQTTVTAGTIFQDTRQPLRLWFRAIWHVTSQKNGASALGLQRVLGLGHYLTAWSWLHKLRRAMVRPGRDRLSGEVEVDETYVGGLAEGPRGRGSLNWWSRRWKCRRFPTNNSKAETPSYWGRLSQLDSPVAEIARRLRRNCRPGMLGLPVTRSVWCERS